MEINDDIIDNIIHFLNYKCTICQKKFLINDYNFFFASNKKLYCSKDCYEFI